MVALRATRPHVSMGGIDPARLAAFSVPVEMTIPRGASLSGLLEKAGLGRSDAYEASAVVQQYLDPTALRAGASYTALVDSQDRVREFLFPQGDRGIVLLARSGGSWRSDWREFERRVETASNRRPS